MDALQVMDRYRKEVTLRYLIQQLAENGHRHARGSVHFHHSVTSIVVYKNTHQQKRVD